MLSFYCVKHNVKRTHSSSVMVTCFCLLSCCTAFLLLKKKTWAWALDDLQHLGSCEVWRLWIRGNPDLKANIWCIHSWWMKVQYVKMSSVGSAAHHKLSAVLTDHFSAQRLRWWGRTWTRQYLIGHAFFCVAPRTPWSLLHVPLDG